jgi:hypothetical protein
MEHILTEHQVVVLLITAFFTLTAKWIWDRWLSQNSRVTRMDCSLIREKCQAEIMGLVKDHTKQLCQGEDSFDSISKTMMVMLLALLKICEKQNIDCEEIHKAMIHKGLIE